MQSMTGFGQATAQMEGVLIEVSIKSVNGRYLEARPHIPKKFLPCEADMMKVLKKRFTRGTIDIYIQRQSEGSQGDVDFTFQNKVAKKWLTEFRKSLKDLKVKDNLEARDLIHIPDFMHVREPVGLNDKEKKLLLQVFEKAIDACQKERVREGESLRKISLEHLKNLHKQIKDLRSQREQFVKDASAKVEAKLQKWLQGAVTMEPSRLMQEVAVLVDRTDIAEELDRLSEHLKNVEDLLQGQGAHGKKLDFYAQELLREVNTIGSKSPSAKIVESVVTAKNIIEQLREQIQNIE